MKIVTLLPGTNKIDSAHYRSAKSVTFLTLRDNAKFNTPAKTPFAFHIDTVIPARRPGRGHQISPAARQAIQ